MGNCKSKAAAAAAVEPAASAEKVALTSIMSPKVAAMRRGMGGRVEEAFAAAKEAGRAAFVTFVTAGYPRAEGTSVLLSPCD